MKKEMMKNTAFRLTETQRSKLEKLASKHNVTPSEMVRFIIDQYEPKKEKIK